ncbi:MAG: class I SAM-dependent methyltransferase [Candidatus Omnitrophota bacterium]
MPEKTKKHFAPDAWWREWFNHIYLDVYAHRDDSGADKEIQAALAFLPLRPSHRILDLCCGNGRHCRALRKAGYGRVFGVDYSYPLLRQSIAESPSAHYLRADMRLLPFPGDSFDAWLSFFTSFGYFKTNVENISVLHEAARVLVHGGMFLLDYLNPDCVRRTLEPETEKKYGDYVIKERRFLSEDGERIEKEIVIENWGGKDHRYFESVRLYTLDEMKEMLESANLHLQGVHGSFLGEEFSPDSQRMILFGTKE